MFEGSLRPAPFDHIEPDHAILPPIIPGKKKGRPKATRKDKTVRGEKSITAKGTVSID